MSPGHDLKLLVDMKPWETLTRAPQQLVDYQMVYDHPPARDETEGQKALRVLMGESPGKFFDQKVGWEKVWVEKEKVAWETKLAELRSRFPSEGSVSSWDGKGACPTCGRAKEGTYSSEGLRALCEEGLGQMGGKLEGDA